VAARALGMPLGGATVTPNGVFLGRTWAGKDVSGLSMGDELCAQALPMMPRAGEERSDAAELIVHSQARVIELLAGRAAELLLYPGVEPFPVISDFHEARAYARIMCLSPAAIESFLAYAEVEAAKLLADHRSVLIALADALVARRELDGLAIDGVIFAELVKLDLEAERGRRLAWVRTIESARSFEAAFELAPAVPIIARRGSRWCPS
jgi:hypothetical protein